MGSYKNVQKISVLAAVLGIITLGVGIWLQAAPAKFDTVTICPDVADNHTTTVSPGPGVPVGIATGILITLVSVAAVALNMEKCIAGFGFLLFATFLLSVITVGLSVKDLVALPGNTTDFNCSNINSTKNVQTTTTTLQSQEITTLLTYPSTLTYPTTRIIPRTTTQTTSKIPSTIYRPRKARRDAVSTNPPGVATENNSKNHTTYETAATETKNRLIGLSCLGTVDFLSQIGSMITCYYAFR